LRTVVKLGGVPTSTPEGLARLVQDILSLEGEVVIVHGGGSEITRWQERLAFPVEWIDGLRVTTLDGVQLTAMVLSGWVNKRIAAAFQSVGRPAAGVSGEDAGLLRAERRDGGRLGEVGTVIASDPRLVQALLSAGILPVVSPLSRGPSGEPLNVNADEAAIALAVALSADRLLLLSDVPGVLRDGLVLAELDEDGVEELIRTGVAGGGMRVKVQMAARAARAGVEVRIGDGALLRSPQAGTRVHAPGPLALGVGA
jgi:acetylglutamate kinase